LTSLSEVSTMTGFQHARLEQRTGLAVKCLRFAFCFSLLALLASGGSIAQFVRSAAVLSWITLFLASLASPVNGQTRRTFVFVLALSIALFAWAFAQSVAMAGNPLANPLWRGAETILGQIPSAISLAPADTIQTLVTVLVPFALFSAALLLFKTDSAAAGAIRMLAAFGLLAAIYGAAQLEFFRDWALFGDRRHYQGSLTSFFANRNTGASFLGLTLLTFTALLIDAIRSYGLDNLIPTAPAPVDGARRPSLALALFLLGGWMSTFTTLLLTKSRAGIGATTAGVVLMILASIYARHWSRRRQYPAAERGRRLMRNLVMTGVALAVIVVFVFFSGRAAFRMQHSWASDPRFCIIPGLWRLLKDNWLTGTGLGTFPLAFPPYKDGACGLSELWLQAHDFFLEGWITLGIFFPVAAVLSVAWMLRVFIRGLRQRNRYRWAPLLGLAALLQQLIHNAVDFPAQNPAVSAFFATLIALCITISLSRGNYSSSFMRYGSNVALQRSS
jgi:hypothetical protein